MSGFSIFLIHGFHTLMVIIRYQQTVACSNSAATLSIDAAVNRRTRSNTEHRSCYKLMAATTLNIDPTVNYVSNNTEYRPNRKLTAATPLSVDPTVNYTSTTTLSINPIVN